MPTDSERIRNINRKLHTHLRDQHGLVWDGGKRKWVPPGATVPPPDDPDDDPIDEPVEDEPVVPVPPGGLWALSAKARANGLGVNLGDFNAWDTTWPFADLAQQAQFRDSNYGYTSPSDFDSREVLLMIGHDMGGLMPWGSFSHELNGTAKINNPGAFDVPKSNEGLQLRVGPGSVSSLRIHVNGWKGVGGFDQTFIDRLAPVAGVIRFMDWQRTNNSVKGSWVEEYQGDKWFAHYGVPLHKMIELCNLLGAWPHFCIPHLASDGYVKTFCAYVKSRLHKDLRAIIELSNEVWNGGFTQSSMGLTGYRDFAKNVMSIVKEELPNSLRLVGTQEDNIGVTDIVLGGDCSMFTHLATGWYLGYWMDGSASTPSDPMQILDKARADIPRLVNSLKVHQQRAQAKGLNLYGYEGGFHLVGTGQYQQAYYERFREAVRHENAGAVESELRAAVRPLLDLACQYTFCGRDSHHGIWGALPWIGADLASAHRYHALFQDAQK